MPAARIYSFDFPAGRLLADKYEVVEQRLAGWEGEIYLLREYHGDLHASNVMVRRYGLGFDLKLLDLFNQGPFSTRRVNDDICDMVRIFYDALGGARAYSRHPTAVKEICRGLKRSLILERFRSARQLARHLETLSL